MHTWNNAFLGVIEKLCEEANRNHDKKLKKN